MERPSGHDPLDSLLRRRLKADAAATGEVCPDVDLLASFMDGSLDSVERGHVERHVSSCTRCTSILAATEASAPALAPGARTAIWTSWRRWQWAVPMATAVLVVGVWFAVPRPGSAPPVTSVSDRAPAPASARPSTPPALRDLSQGEPAAESQTQRNGRELRSSVEDIAAEASAKAAQERASAAPSTTDSAAMRVAVPPADAKETLDAAAESLADARNKDERARVQVRRDEQSTLAALAGPSLVLVRTPNPSVQWRARGGSIERSNDGGTTWRLERSLGGLTVVAGSAPSSDVVWFVTSTLVLRRTAAGWTDTAVSDVQIVSIRATSVTQATIELAGGQRMETTDGGLSWKLR